MELYCKRPQTALFFHEVTPRKHDEALFSWCDFVQLRVAWGEEKSATCARSRYDLSYIF